VVDKDYGLIEGVSLKQGHRAVWRVMEMFCILTVVAVTKFSLYTEICESIMPKFKSSY
jgi:hypothetical protein